MDDRERLRDEPAAIAIRDATKRFVAECATASDAQWTFRPAPAIWSMSHVAEHVATANRNIARLLANTLLQSPIAGRAPDVVDAEIPYLFYRGEEPPNVAAPLGDWTDRERAVEALGTSVSAILDWRAGVNAELRTFGVAHPAFGLLDGVQWLLFVAAHVERHRAQLIGLRQHPAFPA